MNNYNNLSYKDFDFLNPRIRGKYLKVDSNSTEYVSWLCMLQRCYSENNQAYKDYGGRGITICDRWLGIDGFNNFIDDMGLKPSLLYSLDRINNDDNYYPENCRWADKKQQSRNTRKTFRLEIDGVTKAIIEWAEIFNIDYNLVRTRIKRGWNFKDAITTEKMNNKKLSPGDKFGEWTVIEKSGYDYRCQCSCKEIFLVGKFELVNGLSKMCRCCANKISTTNRYKGDLK